MSIRFKFRSSLNFDTVEIENRSSISVRELQEKILRGKNHHQQQRGFDIVFSDAATGLEYRGDDYQIPSGSSVIAKRVPAGTVPSVSLPVEAVKDIGVRGSHSVNPANRPKDEIVGAVVDLCPMPDSELPQFDVEIDANTFNGSEKENVAGLRLECQELDSSGVSLAIQRGSTQTGKEKNILQEDEVVDYMKLNKLSTSNFLAVQSTDLPLELKCSLCNSFFKEAVMIPCCQHSFCDKCIRLVLTEKGRCPKCFSTKCHVQDLLPNLSLRQAIEHFLESQMLDADLTNGMQKYVPDGESGIQANEVSCAVTTVRKEPELAQSSFATGKGSNQGFVESHCDQHHRINVPYGTSGGRGINSAFPSKKTEQIHAVRGGHPYVDNTHIGYEDFAPLTDFQGENQPSVVPQANVHDEANSNIKRKGGFWMGHGGGERNFSALGGYRKGLRNCYVCGSPDHLMRDCPVSNRNPMFQPGNGAFYGGMPGYAPPYWNDSSFPPFRPYANMYNNPAAAMMPFPISPFVGLPYIPSMSSVMPGPDEIMRMGNMGPPYHSDYFGLNRCENNRKHSNEHLRERLPDNEDGSFEGYRHNSPANTHDHKLPTHKEPSFSHSEDSLIRSSEGKTQHDKYMVSGICYVDEGPQKNSRSSFSESDRRHPAERSNSGMVKSHKSSDHHREQRYTHHHGESEKYHERRGQYDSDSSMGNRSTQKGVKRRGEADVRGSHKKHHRHSVSILEPNSHGDRSGHKESDISHGSRYSRHGAKHLRDSQYDERWKTVSGSGEDGRDEYHHRKRKTVY